MDDTTAAVTTVAAPVAADVTTPVAPVTPVTTAPPAATPVPPVDTNPASAGLPPRDYPAGLRSEIAKLVVKFKALDVVTPEMSVRFDAYLTAEEVDLPKIHETLTTAAAEIDGIEAQATAEEQKLLAEYMSEMKLIEKEAKKITLQFEEAVDKDADEVKEAQLLEEVEKV